MGIVKDISEIFPQHLISTVPISIASCYEHAILDENLGGYNIKYFHQDKRKDYEGETLNPLEMEEITIDLDGGVMENYRQFGKALKERNGL